jgi:hypothetical protein
VKEAVGNWQLRGWINGVIYRDWALWNQTYRWLRRGNSPLVFNDRLAEIVRLAQLYYEPNQSDAFLVAVRLLITT